MAVVEVVICNRSYCHNAVEDLSFRFCARCRARGRDNWRRNRQRTSFPCCDCGQERENRKYSRCIACRERWLESLRPPPPPPPPTCPDCGVEVKTAGRCRRCRDLHVQAAIAAEFGLPLSMRFAKGDDPPQRLLRCLLVAKARGLDVDEIWGWALVTAIRGAKWQDMWRAVLVDTSHAWVDAFRGVGPRLELPREMVERHSHHEQGRWVITR